MKNKIIALAQYLECKKSEIAQSSYDENLFEYGSQEYLVVTDDESDKRLIEEVEQTVWAFNPEFLVEWLGCPVEAVKAVQNNGNCESNNEVFIDWLKSSGTHVSTFAMDAAAEDGRGHFLSRYDGNENEETVEGETYYIYRQN